MKKLSIISVLGLSLFALLFFFSACKKNAADASGTNQVKIFLTDDPSIIFDAINIDIRTMEVKVERTDGTESWNNASIRPGIYNILNLRNGIDTLFSNGIITGGSISKIRLTLGTQNTVVKNGISFPLTISDNDKAVIIEVNDADDVDHISSGSSQFWVDFDGQGSIVQVHNNVFELHPRLHTFNNNRTGRLEGRIKPLGALPAMVKVVAGADTLLAVPEHGGEFEIRGIKTSTVKVLIIATSPYKDSIMTTIPIHMGNDNNLGDIVLHQ